MTKDTKFYKLRNGGYIAIHCWLKYHFGSADKCENKKCLHVSQSYQWALLKGKKYEHKRENFIQLCRSCHKKYDYTDGYRKKLSLIQKHTNKRKTSVEQYTKEGKLIRIFERVGDVFKELGILHTSIANNIAGKSKTAGGFIWKEVEQHYERHNT